MPIQSEGKKHQCYWGNTKAKHWSLCSEGSEHTQTSQRPRVSWKPRTKFFSDKAVTISKSPFGRKNYSLWFILMHKDPVLKVKLFWTTYWVRQIKRVQCPHNWLKCLQFFRCQYRIKLKVHIIIWILVKMHAFSFQNNFNRVYGNFFIQMRPTKTVDSLIYEAKC